MDRSFSLRGQMVLPGRGVRWSTLTWSDAHLVCVREGEALESPDVTIPPGYTVIPGMVDLHMHGGEGLDAACLASASLSDEEAVALWHRLSRYACRHGASTLIPGLISCTPEDTLRFLRRASTLPSDPAGARIPGVHLEGPFLAPSRRGAHPPEVIRPPDPDEVRRWVETARGRLALVTLAPELPAALEVSRLLQAHGVTVGVGHTDASYDQMVRAFSEGIRHVVHLFNAMPSLHHRRPAAVTAALLTPEVTCELIADGHHLHRATLRLVSACKAPEEICLVTDSTAAAGVGEGQFTLGGTAVRVTGGRAETPDGRLAGSVITPAGLLRRAGRWLGMSLAEATVVCCTVPARVLGINAGELLPGRRADLAILDDSWNVVATIVGGEIVHGRLPTGR